MDFSKGNAFNDNQSFFTKVAGVTFENRQIYVQKCYAGQPLELIRDKFNPYDKSAIAVYAGNHQVGFLSKELAAKLAPQIDDGVVFACEVSQVTGGNDRVYGLNIKITRIEASDSARIPDMAESTNYVDFREPERFAVPYTSISYANKEYIVVPYPYDGCCLCITDSIIMGLAIEEEFSIYDNSRRAVVKAQLRDPFSHRMMNRKDEFEQLQDEDKRFYYEVFREASKLNTFFQNEDSFDRTRNELLEIIERGVLGKQIDADTLNARMQKLSKKNYSCNFEGIFCNGKASNLYQYCTDVYEI